MNKGQPTEKTSPELSSRNSVRVAAIVWHNRTLCTLSRKISDGANNRRRQMTKKRTPADGRRSLNRLVRAAELEMYEGIAEIRKLTSELESLQHRMARAADALRLMQSPNEKLTDHDPR